MNSCTIACLGKLSNLLSRHYQPTSATKRDIDIRRCTHRKENYSNRNVSGENVANIY